MSVVAARPGPWTCSRSFAITSTAPPGCCLAGSNRSLALARALTRGEPRLLLIDELSLGLAPQVVDRLLQVVTDAKARGVGVLVVEQHIHKALAIADRIYVMRRGRVELSGPAQHFAKDIEAIKTIPHL